MFVDLELVTGCCGHNPYPHCASSSKLLKNWRAREEFEPLTPRSVVWCSIQLSYGRIKDLALFPDSVSLAVASPGHPLRAGAHI